MAQVAGSGKATPSSVIREGDYKLIEFFENGGHRELYNLRSDPGEERDLAATMTEKATVLYRKLKDWQEETGALVPSGANPSYDPKAERPRGGQAGGGRNQQKRGNPR